MMTSPLAAYAQDNAVAIPNGARTRSDVTSSVLKRAVRTRFQAFAQAGRLLLAARRRSP